MITIMTCRFCASRCGLMLRYDNEKLVRISGNPEHPVSRGWCCARGRAATAKQLKGKTGPIVPSL